MREIRRADGFCWFRSKWDVGWAKHHLLFVSHSKPDKDNKVFAWTVGELIHLEEIDRWGLYSNYGVGIDQDENYDDYFMFNADFDESFSECDGKEKKLWQKAGNETRFYKTKRN